MSLQGVTPLMFGETTKAYKLGVPVNRQGIKQLLVSSRGMNILSQRAYVMEHCPELLLTRERPEDMLKCIEASPISHFSQGFAALLCPFANRLPGRNLHNGFQEVRWGEATRNIPINFLPEGLAIHGLVYDSEYRHISYGFKNRHASVKGTTYIPNDLWFSTLKTDTTTALFSGIRARTIEVENVGEECAPVGAGEHPDFKIPHGQPREEVILRIPGKYIIRSGANMLPDFSHGSPVVDVRRTELAGLFCDDVKERRLGELDLDHCFTGFEDLGEISFLIEYPALRWGIKISAWTDGGVNAIQVYSPTDPSLPAYGSIAVEFQTNFADPFNPAWAEYSPLTYQRSVTMPSGMRILAPGEKFKWSVRHSIYSW